MYWKQQNSLPFFLHWGTKAYLQEKNLWQTFGLAQSGQQRYLPEGCLSEVTVMPERCLSWTMVFVPHLSLDPFSGNNIIKPLQRVLTTTEGRNPINWTVLRKETGFPHTVVDMVESREYINQYYLTSLLRTWTVGLTAISARWHQAQRCDWYSRGKGCHSEEPGQGWEAGLGKPHVQQGHVWAPAPGLGQSQTSTSAGQWMDWETPWEKDLSVLVDEKPNINWPCVLQAQEAQCILHPKDHGQQVEEGILLLCSGEMPPAALHPALGPNTRSTSTYLSGCRGGLWGW